MLLDNFITSFITLRERTNPILGPIRRLFLRNKHFSIISNNCWAGHVYRYFSMPYDSPTIGLYFESLDYLKFISNLNYYLGCELKFISIEQSKHKEMLIEQDSDKCPIGTLDDIEVIFLHYKSKEEAYTKWNRRKSRIHWDSLYIKMAEQNGCTEEQIKTFDSLPYKDKIIFVHKDYHIDSQILFREYRDSDYVLNDTKRFKYYINLINWLNHKPCKLNQ